MQQQRFDLQRQQQIDAANANAATVYQNANPHGLSDADLAATVAGIRNGQYNPGQTIDAMKAAGSYAANSAAAATRRVIPNGRPPSANRPGPTFFAAEEPFRSRDRFRQRRYRDRQVRRSPRRRRRGGERGEPAGHDARSVGAGEVAGAHRPQRSREADCWTTGARRGFHDARNHVAVQPRRVYAQHRSRDCWRKPDTACPASAAEALDRSQRRCRQAVDGPDEPRARHSGRDFGSDERACSLRPRPRPRTLLRRRRRPGRWERRPST